MRFELRGLERTQERLTFREGFTNIARLMPGWLLWVEAILTLVFVAAGILMLIIEPAKWMIALGGIVFFGTRHGDVRRHAGDAAAPGARSNPDAGDRPNIESTMTGVFKTGRDGRKLFFPWGPRSTSFVIPTQARYRRLRLQVTSYTIVALLLIVGTAIWLPFYVSLGVAVLMGWLYSAWTPRLVRGLPLSAERMSDRNR